MKTPKPTPPETKATVIEIKLTVPIGELNESQATELQRALRDIETLLKSLKGRKP